MIGTAVCKDVFERIEQLYGEYVGFWADICRIESPTEYKEGVDRVGSYIIEKARQRGWKIEVQPQQVSGDCICITMNPDAEGQPVCFSGHMDTVHPVGSFGDEPVRIEGEKMYGPGVQDCKGGIAASFLAMAAMEDCGVKTRPIKLILQSDEENSSRNSQKTTVQFMCEKAEGCAAFLNCEPYVRGITLGRKGIRKYSFEVTGSACHASACYNGVSAIREAAYKIIELEKLKDKEGLTCNCGIISGGTAENTVPDKCVFTADIRFSNEEEKMKADRLVEEIAAKSFVEGSSCKVMLKSYRCAMEVVERNMELYRKAMKICEETGLPVSEWVISTGGADAADLTEYGIPCLDSVGTEGGGMHQPTEFSYIASLAKSAKRLAAIACCI
ncbi:MAG: M20 family metallopeptidase [Ruminococcaceae bacterium]|nr:M20 family metallopeptidase [Oscillospiraceae bacterium]